MSTMTALGLMSGTSMDGVDAALMQSDGESQIHVIEKKSLHYPFELTVLLKATEYAAQQVQGCETALRQQFSTLLQDYCADKPEQFKQQLAQFCQRTILAEIGYDDVIKLSTDYHRQLCQQFSEFDLIAYHGQTLFHDPQRAVSLQVGDPQQLAEAFQCRVVSQFRQADIKSGGEGAPLAPIYHFNLAKRDQLIPLAIVNCGGISNITLIQGDAITDVISFDIGPGNVLIDRYIRQQRPGERFDKDGQYGQQGNVQEELLTLLKQTACRQADYFSKPPPKSLDSYDFNLIPQLDNYDFYDVCRTLEAFTARSIVDSLLTLKLELPQYWILAGGGWKNPIITQALYDYLSETITPYFLSPSGWDKHYLEAELMAYLGIRRLKRLPITFPNTTGVKRATVGGELFVGHP